MGNHTADNIRLSPNEPRRMPLLRNGNRIRLPGNSIRVGRPSFSAVRRSDRNTLGNIVRARDSHLVDVLFADAGDLRDLVPEHVIVRQAVQAAVVENAAAR